MDIKNLDWRISAQNLEKSLEDVTVKPDYIYGKCIFWGKACSATFRYSESKEIKRIEISLFKATGPGAEAIDFKKTFIVLKEALGEPLEYINIDPVKAEQLKDVYKELKLEKLPKILWEIEGKRIVHRFIDHWGIIPETYIEKI